MKALKTMLAFERNVEGVYLRSVGNSGLPDTVDYTISFSPNFIKNKVKKDGRYRHSD